MRNFDRFLGNRRNTSRNMLVTRDAREVGSISPKARKEILSRRGNKSPNSTSRCKAATAAKTERVLTREAMKFAMSFSIYCKKPKLLENTDVIWSGCRFIHSCEHEHDGSSNKRLTRNKQAVELIYRPYPKQSTNTRSSCLNQAVEPIWVRLRLVATI